MLCHVTRNTPLAPGFFHLALTADTGLGPITPGMFVMVRAGNGSDPFLRRPFSIADFSLDGKSFGLLVQVVGLVSKALSRLNAGDSIDITGPFGNGFKLPGTPRKIWIVAGGTGVAPFIGLTDLLKGDGKDVTLFLGARTEQFLLLKERFENNGVSVVTATEDGSSGFSGFVTEPLQRELATGTVPDTLLTCGPTPMMKAVSTIMQERKIPCYVSLENYMACGFGACLGCVTKSANHDGYVSVCKKGPVFLSTEVTF